MLEWVILACWYVARLGDVIICDIDDNLQRSKMYLYVRFVCSTPDYVGGVYGKPDRPTEIKVN